MAKRRIHAPAGLAQGNPLDRLRETDLVKRFPLGFHLLCRKDPPAPVETDPGLRLLHSLLERQGFI